jgi:hypothetical protein
VNAFIPPISSITASHVSKQSPNVPPWYTTNPTIAKLKNAHHAPITPSSLFPPHPQFHPIIPCRSTCVCLTNPTLLPIIPSPPTPRSSFLGKLKDSVVNADNGNACRIDVIGLEALRSPSRLLFCQSTALDKKWRDYNVQDYYLTTAQLCIRGGFGYRDRLECCCCGGSFGLVKEE